MSHAYEASWATEPYFYRAPWPEAELVKKDIRIGDYQLAGVEYSLGRDHAIIGDEPGLGKSCQGVVVSNAIRARRTLVSCPASLRWNWEREIWMWSTTPNVSTYPVVKASDGISNTADYVIVSYALLRNPSILKAILDLRWDHVILDEAHAIKDPKGNKQTQAITGHTDKYGNEFDGVADVAGRFTLLTGTLLPNQPIECYNACRLLDWDTIDCASLEEFRNHYYEPGGGFVMRWDPSKKKRVPKWSENVRNTPVNEEELGERLRTHLMIRRTREMVLPQLPPCRWHTFPISTNSAIKKALSHPGWAQAEKLYQMDPDAFDHGVPVDGDISTARRLLGEAKAPAVADYIEDLLDSGVHKLVVGAYHISVLAYLRERLAKYGLVYMDGSTSPTKKQQAVDAFQMREDVRIIEGQMLPLGEGWTLTAAQDLVNVEPFWVPGKNTQLLYRINRVGQTGGYTLGHMPLVPGTLDEKIVGGAIVKDRSIYRVLDTRN